MSYLPDTSCLVSLLCTWHEHHEKTLKELTKRERSGDHAILAAHSLVETYAVLTRLPYPYRLSENDAWELLEKNFSKTTIVSLTNAQYWKVLKECCSNKISGGQVYDAMIAACASKGKVRTLLTWNREHFLPFQDQHLIVQTPAG
jgi:predicted nucleic acid-binding protein